MCVCEREREREKERERERETKRETNRDRDYMFSRRFFSWKFVEHDDGEIRKRGMADRGVSQKKVFFDLSDIEKCSACHK